MTGDPRPLTARQRQVAELLAAGLSRRDIASALGCSAETVKVHVREIARRLPGDVSVRRRCAVWVQRRAAA
jgi:DNA-binding NarL/FixJ family response regulator